jgi:hypothetical protein
MIAAGATMAPRVEILTMLACDHLKPEYTAGHGLEDLGIHPWGPSPSAASLDHSLPVSSFQLATHEHSGDELHDTGYVNWEASGNGTVPPNPGLCKTDPVVQAAVAKLQASKFPYGITQ